VGRIGGRDVVVEDDESARKPGSRRPFFFSWFSAKARLVCRRRGLPEGNFFLVDRFWFRLRSGVMAGRGLGMD